MKTIQLKSFAKINLTLDVFGLLENGYHEVAMIMQQILLCDDVDIKWKDAAGGSADDNISPGDNKISIELSTNRSYLPTDNRNLAYKAAALMADEFGSDKSGLIRIDIKKRIPVAAGLAGGSSNAAVVLHGLNKLWNLGLSVSELCTLGGKLGSDIPFCVMGQAAANDALKDDFKDDPLACHCALATGTGTELKPLTGLKSHLVLSKPAISVSTAEVYKGIDNEIIERRPSNDEMIAALKAKDIETVKKNLVNVLENFTLKRYPIVKYTKDKMSELCYSDSVLMSGSGPTVFGFCSNINESRRVCEAMLELNKESFWTRTTW